MKKTLKCPYCGTESETRICKQCKALIPSPKETPKPSEPPKKEKEKE